MIELTDSSFYMIWGASGICMIISYFIGRTAGYKQMHLEIASSLVDIELERAFQTLFCYDLLLDQTSTENGFKNHIIP